MEWTALEDKHPLNHQICFITDGNVVDIGVADTKSFDYVYWDGLQCGGHDFEFNFNNEDVTHWMNLTLPELPVKI